MINYVYSPDSTESANRKLMNGQILNIVDHTDWFAIFGNTYGGDGVTTFALPDVRNRLFVGAGTSFTAGSFYGSSNVTLVGANLPSHSHSSGTLRVQGSLSGPEQENCHDGTICTPGGTDTYAPYDYNLTNSSSISGATGSTGANQPFDIIPPVFAVYVFIETV